MIINILYNAFNLPVVVAHAMGYTGSVYIFAIDTAINPSPATVYGFLSAYADTGRSAVIIAHLVFDTVFIVIYSDIVLDKTD